MSVKDDPLSPVLKKYLAENRILVADPNSGSCVRMAATLVEMGSKRNMIDVASHWEDAQRLTLEKRPGLVLCEFQLGSKSGLDLLQELRETEKKKNECIFVLVTGNTSQSAVAQAAEEDVDSFILKPYSLVTLKKALSITINAKINPSKYITTIELGKEMLFSGNTEGAEKAFNEAMGMDPKPTLAHFYLGQTKAMKFALESAMGSYKDGLSLNKIHYKCLVGLYELLSKEKRYDDAYDVVRRIAQYFPANPKRLSSVLRLAITTKNYDDIESYYRLFTLLDDRDPELVNYVCAALIVTSKYYLTTNVQTRALELLEKAAISCAGRTKFLRFIVETMTEFSLAKEAAGILKRFTSDSQSGEDYLTAKFLVSALGKDNNQTIAIGRDLIKGGVKNPLVYRNMVLALLRSGLTDPAEDTARAAQSLWPAMHDEFEALLKKAA